MSKTCRGRGPRQPFTQVIPCQVLRLLDESNRVAINTHADSRSVIRLIEADGWIEVRQKGSHKQFRHPTKPGLVTVPSPKKDIPTGTLRSIAKVAGLVLE